MPISALMDREKPGNIASNQARAPWAHLGRDARQHGAHCEPGLHSMTACRVRRCMSALEQPRHGGSTVPPSPGILPVRAVCSAAQARPACSDRRVLPCSAPPPARAGGLLRGGGHAHVHLPVGGAARGAAPAGGRGRQRARLDAAAGILGPAGGRQPASRRVWVSDGCLPAWASATPTARERAAALPESCVHGRAGRLRPEVPALAEPSVL